LLSQSKFSSLLLFSLLLKLQLPLFFYEHLLLRLLLFKGKQPLIFLVLKLLLLAELLIFSLLKLESLAFGLTLLFKFQLLLAVSFLLETLELALPLIFLSFQAISLGLRFSGSSLRCLPAHGLLEDVIFALGSDFVLLEPLIVLLEKREGRLNLGNKVSDLLLLLIGKRILHPLFLMLRLSDIAIVENA
jgi:hypothetical protein